MELRFSALAFVDIHRVLLVHCQAAATVKSIFAVILNDSSNEGTKNPVWAQNYWCARNARQSLTLSGKFRTLGTGPPVYEILFSILYLPSQILKSLGFYIFV